MSGINNTKEIISVNIEMRRHKECHLPYYCLQHLLVSLYLHELYLDLLFWCITALSIENNNRQYQGLVEM